MVRTRDVLNKEVASGLLKSAKTRVETYKSTRRITPISAIMRRDFFMIPPSEICSSLRCKKHCFYREKAL